MPAISLLSKTYTYTNGNPNDADEVELDLANAYANFGTIQTDYNQLVTGAYTLAGVKTFSSPITLSANSASVAGSLGYSSNVLSYYNGTKRVELTEAINANNYLGGKPPTYTSAATITLPAGLSAMDSTNANIMVVASDQVVSLASSGANGLDTGSEAGDTWYYVYLIGSSTDSATYPTKGLFSVTNEAASGSITLPANYDIKRQLPLAVRNDGSSNIIPFYCPQLGTVLYNEAFEPFGTSPLNVLNAGASTTFADVALSAFVPAIANVALLHTNTQVTGGGGSASGTLYVRPDGESHNGFSLYVKDNDYTHAQQYGLAILCPSQTIEYKSATNWVMHLDVTGYKVTEVA